MRTMAGGSVVACDLAGAIAARLGCRGGQQALAGRASAGATSAHRESPPREPSLGQPRCRCRWPSPGSASIGRPGAFVTWSQLALAEIRPGPRWRPHRIRLHGEARGCCRAGAAGPCRDPHRLSPAASLGSASVAITIRENTGEYGRKEIERWVVDLWLKERWRALWGPRCAINRKEWWKKKAAQGTKLQLIVDKSLPKYICV
jgi:hypothetical protein